MTDQTDSNVKVTAEEGNKTGAAAGSFSGLADSGLGAFDSLPVPCFLVKEGLFVAANKAFYDFAGQESTFFVDRAPYRLLAAACETELEADDRAVMAGEQVSPVAVPLLVSGEASPVDAVIKKSLATDAAGNSLGVLATIERAEAAGLRQALQESESEKKAILDGFPGILCLFDKEARVIWVNNKLLEIHDAPIGRSCHELFCQKTEGCGKCVLGWDGTATGSEPAAKRCGFVNDVGEEFIYEITGTPVRDEAGEITSMLVIGWDVTEKYKLEKQLRHSQKMEAIGTLAGGIAHDFNNVLTPIIGYSEIIRLKLMQDNSLDQSIQDYLDGIMRAAKRAKKLVEQVLTFSRSSEQKESLQYLHPIIKEVMKLMRVSLPSTVTIEERIDEGCGMVMVDPVQIHQVLINLCSNSSEAMAGSHGTLTVTLAPAESAGDGEDWLKLSVTDTGCGIEQEKLERIFDPYFTTKEKSQGTGMGLAMVHGIIQRQGGRVEVQSRVGVGTTFELYLPVAAKAAGQEQQGVSAADLIRGSGHILLVDDEAQVVQVTSELLTSLGYTVTGRTSAYDALALFLQNPSGYDLLLTDLTMPELTGVELCQKIKAIRKDLPVVLFTGYSEQLPRESAESAGIDQYCMKPVSMRELSSVVHSTMSMARS